MQKQLKEKKYNKYNKYKERQTNKNLFRLRNKSLWNVRDIIC